MSCPGTKRHGIRHTNDCRGRRWQVEQHVCRNLPTIVAEVRDLDQVRVRRDAIVSKRTLIPVQSVLCELMLQWRADKGDLLMPQTDKMIDRRDKCRRAINVVPRIIVTACGAAMDHERALQIRDQSDPRVVLERA